MSRSFANPGHSTSRICRQVGCSSIPPPLTAAGQRLYWAREKLPPAPAPPRPSPTASSSSHRGFSPTLRRPTLTKTFHVFQLTCNSSPNHSLQDPARALVTWPWTLFELHALPSSPLGSSHTSRSFCPEAWTCCSLSAWNALASLQHGAVPNDGRRLDLHVT